MRYRVSEVAERDLDEIFAYWATRVSLEVADRIVDAITERFGCPSHFSRRSGTTESIQSPQKAFIVAASRPTLAAGKRYLPKCIRRMNEG
jgi:plasmid stabilization system protein ParE